jgi:protocatechuate 3,4-dioxygenase beta subunit
MTNFARLKSVPLFAAFLLGIASEVQACMERMPTPQAGAGPHDYSQAPSDSRLWRDGDEGEQLFLRARVLDTCGGPVAGALVKLRHASHAGDFLADRWRADLKTDAHGAFTVLTVLPGYAGGLPRHMHFIISHSDHRQLVTRVYFKSDPAAKSDASDLAIVLEEVQRDQGRGWAGSHEFVMTPK